MKKVLSLLLALCLCLSIFPTAALADEAEDFVIDENGMLTKYNGPGGDVVIPDGVTEIGPYAFSRTSLKSVTIPNGVTSIGDWAFYKCGGLTSVTLPDSITKIGFGAFSDTSLTNITIPDGVTEIGQYAFRDCTGLTSITIPASVTKIWPLTFDGCTNLASATVHAETEYNQISFTSTTEITQVGHVFEIKDGLLHHYRGSDGNVVIPDGVTMIAVQTFRGDKNLTSVTIPDSVTKIDYEAFQNCTNLTSVTIPNSVTQIGDGTFKGCTSLTSITIPNSVTKIGAYAFGGCTSLTSVTIPDSVTEIGHYAFRGCTGLKSITIPDGITEIGHSAFADCTALTSVSVPYSVKYISSVFPSTTKITRVGEYFDIQDGVLKGYNGPGGNVVIPDGVTSIQCGYYNDSLIYSPFINHSKLTSVTIPEGVTRIGEYTFYGCSNLTSVTLPDTVTYIGEAAFMGCSSLTNINIPNGVTTIGDRAFYDCGNLTSLAIPNNATKIGSLTFAGCNGLTSMTIPGGVMKASIGGCDNLSSVAVLSGVKEVSLNLPNLKSVSLPDSVEKLSISSNALRELVIPAGATEWPQLNCPRLGKLTFPKDNWVFKGISRDTFMDKIKNYPSLNEIVNCPNEFVPDLITANKTLRDNWTNPKSTIVPQSARITQLSNEITAGLTNDYDKAKAISQWVVDHIKYDDDYYYAALKDYSDVPFNPEEILDKGQAVCAGISRLTQALLVAQGIPCLYVLGWAGEYHAWNLAYIDGDYLWIDNTWGMQYFGLGVYAISRDHTATGAASFNDVKGPGTLVQGSSEAAAVTEVAEDASTAAGLPSATGTAYPSTQTVLVDGKAVEFQCYALKDANGFDTNYIKLRDLADVLSDTAAQFQVGWDGNVTITTGQSYTKNGSEQTTPFSGQRSYTKATTKTLINGQSTDLAAFVLNDDAGGGYTYYQLRDLGKALGFNVGWDNHKGIFVETDKPYDANN